MGVSTVKSHRGDIFFFLRSVFRMGLLGHLVFSSNSFSNESMKADRRPPEIVQGFSRSLNEPSHKVLCGRNL